MKTLYETFKDIFTAEDPCTVLKTLECLLKATKEFKTPTIMAIFNISINPDEHEGITVGKFRLSIMSDDIQGNNAYEKLKYLVSKYGSNLAGKLPCTGYLNDDDNGKGYVYDIYYLPATDKIYISYATSSGSGTVALSANDIVACVTY